MSGTPQAPTATVTDALWTRYRASGDPEARTALLDRYLGLVHHVAREMAARSTAAELDDLVSAGTLGLVRALESFEPERGLAFSTYAVRRIRGAILDDLRSRDWIPRSVRTKARQLAAAVGDLQRVLGRLPEPQEVATAIGIDIETYWQWRNVVDGGMLVSLDGVTASDRGSVTLAETIEDANAERPGATMEVEQEHAQLRRCIASLPEKERMVLSFYYFEELNLRQIAEVLHVTESRVSQIRTQAIRRLRERMRAEEDAA